MHRLFLLLFIIPSFIFSDESVVPAFEGEPSGIVHNCVDVITGSYFETELDLCVEGPEPIRAMRSYSSWDTYEDSSLGTGWHFNYPH